MKKPPILLLIKSFRDPLLVLVGILLYLFFQYIAHMTFIADAVVLVAIALGSYELFVELYHQLRKGQYALDYIAALAIIVSLITGEYLVCSIIALMISSGRNLEEYGVSQAKKSLSLLAKRIPQEVFMYKDNQPGPNTKLKDVRLQDHILIRKGEIIPLDGILVSKNGQTDEASLTGEPYYIDKVQGDVIRSGTINVGQPMVVEVTKIEKDSTYRKILAMVEKAQSEKAPLVRLADTYSTYFTVITFIIAVVGFIYLGGLKGALAVLVIATPCPLIIATPIALLGGVNAAAKRRIIVKNLASLESLSRVTTMVFDKTGTITIGKPTVTQVKIHDTKFTETKIIAIASAIERNSLHPIAKALVKYAQEKKVPMLMANNTREIIGKGIQAEVEGKIFSIHQAKNTEEKGILLDVLLKDKAIATIQMLDEIKDDSKSQIQQFAAQHIDLHIFTGDKRSEAERITAILGSTVHVEAEMSPERKQAGIEALQHQGKIVAMLGDGINDAPALAKADVGMVFSNEQQTASSEAADVILLGNDLALAEQTIRIAKRTIGIALQSIRWGIGLSVIGMVFAAFGFIPPLIGAGLQEAIDVAVILNALRASKG